MENIENKSEELNNYKILFEKNNFNFSIEDKIYCNTLIDDYINNYNNSPSFKNYIEAKFTIYEIIYENYGFYNYFRDENNYYLCFDCNNYKFISKIIYDSIKSFENYKINDDNLCNIKIIFIEKQKGYTINGAHINITLNTNLILEKSTKYLYLNIIQDKIFETVNELL